MNVLILGSGGREHAFSIKLLESNKINQLFVAPGNAGTDKIATNININPTDFEAVKKAVLDLQTCRLLVNLDNSCRFFRRIIHTWFRSKFFIIFIIESR
jgi:hypothetical protein